MGLSSAFQNAAKAAANALGDVAEIVTYRKSTAVTYDPAVSATPSETFTSVVDIDAIWSNINASRVNGQNVLARDRSVILFGKDLGATVPKENGEILRTMGDLFSYTGAGTADDFSFEADPYNAIRGASLGAIAVGQILHISQATESGNTGIATVTGKNTGLIVVDKTLTAEDSSTAIIQNAEVWRVVNVSVDPAGATYICQVRQ